MRFFEPTQKFIGWLAAYAGERIVFDVGCGDGHVLTCLHYHGVKAMGIDPRYQCERMPLELMSCVLPQNAQECKILKNTQNSLVLFCRPCHSGFVADTIRLLPQTAEVLYISKPSNVNIDLADFETELVDSPRCKEHERVYRIKREA